MHDDSVPDHHDLPRVAAGAWAYRKHHVSRYQIISIHEFTRTVDSIFDINKSRTSIQYDCFESLLTKVNFNKIVLLRESFRLSFTTFSRRFLLL